MTSSPRRARVAGAEAAAGTRHELRPRRPLTQEAPRAPPAVVWHAAAGQVAPKNRGAAELGGTVHGASSFAILPGEGLVLVQPPASQSRGLPSFFSPTARVALVARGWTLHVFVPELPRALRLG